MKYTIKLATLFIMVGVIWFLQGNIAIAKAYRLVLSGEAGSSFNGTCTIAENGGERILILKGQVPYDQKIVGHGLSCKLEAKGRVVVEIKHRSSATRSATNGGRISINLR